MKLLLDENLSPRIIEQIGISYDEVTQVDALGLRGATDTTIWNFAKENGYTIVSKDSDFRDRALLYGHPPKVVWLNIGNCKTADVVNILNLSKNIIKTFINNNEDSFLELCSSLLSNA